jgi:hypothetical protein
VGHPQTGASPGPTDDANARLNARLRGLLPSGMGETMHQYAGATLSRDNAVAVIPVPEPILKATFAFLRTLRTLMRPATLTYVYGPPHRDLLGRTVCKAYRITEHPQPTAPPRFDPNSHQPSFPAIAGTQDLPPQIDDVEVPCNDPHLQHVTPGSLTTPLPLAP